jgi:hypothetical protein
MKVKDKAIGEIVDVAEKHCIGRRCYWPRPDPGVFTPGKGYKSRGSTHTEEYICGTRAIHGCPDDVTKREE